MGAGATGGENAKRWEGLVGELQMLCEQQKKMIKSASGESPIPSPKAEEFAGRRRSSILKKESLIDRKRPSGSADATDTTVRRSSSVVSFSGEGGQKDVVAALASVAANGNCTSPTISSPTNRSINFSSNLGSPIPSAFDTLDDSTIRSETTSTRKSRADQMKLRATRKQFFDQYMDDPINPGSELACSYVGLICTSLSYLMSMENGSNFKLGVEDIFFTNHLPLHFVNLETITLSELYAICKEFVDTDPRFKDVVRVEVFYMDTRLVEGEVQQGERANESGDRGPPSLQVFRKSLEEDFNGLSACRIFCYDPFVVEQAKLRIDDTDSDEGSASDMEEPGEYTAISPNNGNAPPTTPSQTLDSLTRYSARSAPKSKFGSSNDGKFSLCTAYNSVQHQLQLVDSNIDGSIHLTSNDAPITAMYRACCTKDRGTERKRGFVRFSLIDSSPPLGSIEEMPGDLHDLFVPDLYSGAGMRGIPLTSVDSQISGHITAFAFALHLVQGLQPFSETGVGINIKDICTAMQFPLNVIVNYPMSLIEAYTWMQSYITNHSVWNEKIFLHVQPIEKKVDSEDSPPTMSIMEFSDILVTAQNSKVGSSVTILQFDVNVAHSVLGLSGSKSASSDHYGVFMGYDADKQLVKILDIHPKKYTRFWVTSLQRLHSAIIGRGFIVVQRARRPSQDSEMCFKRQDTMIRTKLAKLYLPPVAPAMFVHAFEYPTKVMATTAVAVAINHLLDAKPPIMVRNFINSVDCDPSFLVDSCISLCDLHRITISYLVKSKNATKVSAEYSVFDELTDGTRRVSLDQFTKMVTTATQNSKDEILILNCGLQFLKNNGGGNGGFYCIVHDISDSNILTISDVNPSLYSRFLYVPIDELYHDLCEKDILSRRSRGVMRLSKTPLNSCYQEGRFIDLFKVPQWQQFRIPQCVHLNVIALALSMMGHPCCAEEIFYTAYTCLGGERYRRGSAIFPWQQLKITLGELNERMTVTAVAKMVMKFEQATNHDLTASTIIGISKDDFASLVEETSLSKCPYLLAVIINTEHIFHIKLSEEESQWKFGCGIIKDYDDDTGIVQVVEANSTRYGGQWSCTLDELYAAADLDSVEQSENGLIKIGKLQTGLGAKRKSMVQKDFKAAAF